MRAKAHGMALLVVALHYLWRPLPSEGSAFYEDLPAMLLSRSLHCNKIPLPKQFFIEDRGLFNPAATYHPELGWLVVFRYDECYWQRCGGPMRVQPVLAVMGSDDVPEPGMVEHSLMRLKHDNATRQAAWAELSADTVVAGDIRPFMWHGRPFLAHWIYKNSTQHPVQALSELDVDHRRMRLRHIFRAIGEFRVDGGWQKNWAYAAHAGELLVFPQFFPDVHVLRFTPGAGVAFHNGWRLRPTVARLLANATGLDPVHARNSGHPAPWADGRSGAGALILVHMRVNHYYYYHWAVRGDLDTGRISRVSRGPVLRWIDYHLRGYMAGALVVGSYHILPPPPTGGLGRRLRIFFGEGDKFACVEDLVLDNIDWFDLPQGAYQRLINPYAVAGEGPGTGPAGVPAAAARAA